MLTSALSDPPAPRKCAMCPALIAATERNDKKFCSDACRSLCWQRKNRSNVSAYTVNDFAEVMAVLARNEARLGRKAKLIGYSLGSSQKGNAAWLGEVSFPDPNRKTKRFPDESGVARVRKEPFFRYAPFEPPRVPCVGSYHVTLHWDDGHVGTTGDSVWVKRAYPSVPYYDKAGNRYDLKGKLLPKGKSVTPPARRKYLPRRQSPTASDAGLPIEPVIRAQRYVAMARVGHAEQEAAQGRVATMRLSHDRDPMARVQALTDQISILTAKLSAAEARALQAERDAKEQLIRTEEWANQIEREFKESLLRAEERAVQAEAALLAHDEQSPFAIDKFQQPGALVKSIVAGTERSELERFLMPGQSLSKTQRLADLLKDLSADELSNLLTAIGSKCAVRDSPVDL